MRRIDLTGQKFGMITVLSYAGRMKSGGTGWNARCDCGTEFVVNGGHLTQKGYAKRSCGCLKSYAKDMVGKTFDRLTVREVVKGKGTGAEKRKTVSCDCECGTTRFLADPYSLHSGHTSSCGCMRHDSRAKDRVGDIYGKLEVLERSSPVGEKPVFWRCRCECGNVSTYLAGNLQTGNSTQCEPCRAEALAASNAKGVSRGEKEVSAFIESLGFTPRHGRIDVEGSWLFDAVVEEKKIVFEYNGVYFHSHPRTRRGKHQYKRKYAAARGYRMITIWEDDWTFQREKMEALIRRSLLGARSRGARDFDVVPLPKEAAESFHKEWHIQGYALRIPAVHYALVESGSPVAVATFRTSGVLERYALVEGLSIPGGLPRLIKAFRAEHGNVDIVTFCDRDHFSGAVYEAVGFEHVDTNLQMWYVRGPRRESRQRYMKHKLPDRFGEVDMSMTERDICAENGVYAAYNSGTDKYVLKAAPE